MVRFIKLLFSLTLVLNWVAAFGQLHHRNYTDTALKFINRGEYDRGLMYLNESIRQSPNYSRSYIYRALTFYYNGLYEDAIRDNTQGVKLEPELYNTWENRGLSYLGIRDYANALSDLNAALKLNPKDSLGLGARAAVWFCLGNKQKAQSDIDALTGIVNNRESALLWCAKWSVLPARYDIAVSLTKEALRLAPDRMDLLSAHQQYLNLAGQKDEAAKLLNNLRVKYPEKIEFIASSGNLHESKEEYTEAISEYSKALAAQPRNANYVIGRAFNYLYSLDTAKAFSDLRVASTLAEQDYNLLNSIGFAYLYAGRYAEALDYYTSALASNRYSSDALLGLIIILAKNNHYERIPDFLNQLKHVIAYRINNSALNRYKTFLDVAANDIIPGNYQAALQKLNSYLDTIKRPVNPLYLGSFRVTMTLRGEVRETLGDLEGALADYNDVLHLDPLPRDLNEAITRVNKKRNGLTPKTLNPFRSSQWITPEETYAEAQSEIARISRKIASNPGNISNYSERATHKIKAGDYPGAIADCNIAEKLAKAAKVRSFEAIQAAGIRGIAEYRANHNHDAIKDLQLANTTQSDVADFQYYYGLASCKDNDPDLSLRIFQNLVKSNPRNPDYWEGRGDAYGALGYNFLALKDYYYTLVFEPRRATTLSNRGFLLMNNGRILEAIEDFSSGIASDSTIGTIWANRADAYGRLWRYDKSSADRQESIRQDPNNIINIMSAVSTNVEKRRAGVQKIYDRAFEDFQLSRLANSVFDCDSILSADSTDREIRFYRAYCYFKKDQPSYALRDLEAIERIERNGLINWGYETLYLQSADFINFKSIVLSKLQNYQQAIDEDSKLLASRPDDPVGLDNRGTDYTNAGKLDSAIFDLKRSISLNPNNPVPYSHLQLVYILQNNYTQVLRIADEGLKYTPDNFELLFNKWTACMVLQTPAMKSSDFKIINANKEYAGLGVASEMLYDFAIGQFGKGNELYKILSINYFADMKEVKYDVFLNNYITGCHYFGEGRLKEALGALSIANSLYAHSRFGSSNPIAKYIYANSLTAAGNAQYQLHNYSAALDLYRKAAELDPESIFVRDHIAEISTTTGKKSVPIIAKTPLIQHGPGKLHAIFIANDHYTKVSGLPSLSGCRNDALQIQMLLTQQYGLLGENCDTLFNAGKDEILAGLRRHLSRIDKNDQLIIFYSGHGALGNDQHPTSQWIPVNARGKEDYISADSVQRMLTSCKANQKLILSDACFSGSFHAAANQAKQHLTVITSSSDKTVAEQNDFAGTIIAALNENQVSKFSAVQLFSSIYANVRNKKISGLEPKFINLAGPGSETFIFQKSIL